MSKLCSMMQWPLPVVVSDVNFSSIQQQKFNCCH